MMSLTGYCRHTRSGRMMVHTPGTGMAVREILAFLLFVLLPAPGPARQWSPDPRALFEDAQRALLAHDYAKAEQGFRKYLEIDPHSAAGYSNLGVVYMRLGRYASAIEAFQDAKKLAPQLTQLDLNLGLAYYH